MRDLVEHYRILELGMELRWKISNKLGTWWSGTQTVSLQSCLQQGSGKKLKLVNEAYEKLRSYHHNGQNSAPKSRQEHGPQSILPHRKTLEEFNFIPSQLQDNTTPLFHFRKQKCSERV